MSAAEHSPSPSNVCYCNNAKVLCKEQIWDVEGWQSTVSVTCRREFEIRIIKFISQCLPRRSDKPNLRTLSASRVDSNHVACSVPVKRKLNNPQYFNWKMVKYLNLEI